MSINSELLGSLITWAASDYIRGTDPEKAIALGIAKEGDKSLGKWNQGAWGHAERNGVCQTAFCIAGGAVAMDDSAVVVMDLEDEHGGLKYYSATYVVKKSALPANTKLEFGYLWLNGNDSLHDFGVSSHEHIENYAMRLLGLSDEQATAMFAGSNSIERVVSLAFAFIDQDDEANDLVVPDYVAEFNQPSEAWVD